MRERVNGRLQSRPLLLPRLLLVGELRGELVALRLHVAALRFEMRHPVNQRGHVGRQFGGWGGRRLFARSIEMRLPRRAGGNRDFRSMREDFVLVGFFKPRHQRGGRVDDLGNNAPLLRLGGGHGQLATLPESGLDHVSRDALRGQRGANRLVDLVEHFGRVSVRVLAANSHAPRAVEQEQRIGVGSDWHPGLKHDVGRHRRGERADGD